MNDDDEGTKKAAKIDSRAFLERRRAAEHKEGANSVCLGPPHTPDHAPDETKQRVRVC